LCGSDGRGGRQNDSNCDCDSQVQPGSPTTHQSHDSSSGKWFDCDFTAGTDSAPVTTSSSSRGNPNTRTSRRT
jgi:hypothetical protein